MLLAFCETFKVVESVTGVEILQSFPNVMLYLIVVIPKIMSHHPQHPQIKSGYMLFPHISLLFFHIVYVQVGFLFQHLTLLLKLLNMTNTMAFDSIIPLQTITIQPSIRPNNKEAKIFLLCFILF
jgi:hypothetical protein